MSRKVNHGEPSKDKPITYNDHLSHKFINLPLYQLIFDLENKSTNWFPFSAPSIIDHCQRKGFSQVSINVVSDYEGFCLRVREQSMRWFTVSEEQQSSTSERQM